MKRRVLNGCLILSGIVLLAILASFVRVGATADTVVVLRTAGMTCGSCAEQVTRALQSERGVASTEVDLAGGRVMAGFDAKQTGPGKLAAKVAAAGYASQVQSVLTPEQFKSLSGHQVGSLQAQAGCCGKVGCGSAKVKN